MTLQEKTKKLKGIFEEMGSVVVGFSGGIDSTLAVRVAHGVLGDRVLAVIGDSESVLRSELAEAIELVESMGAPYRVIYPRELDDPDYAENPSNRCFFCKNELFSELTELADQEGYACVVDGSNADDAGDHRPGHQAAAKHKVRHPLQEAGFTKDDIRALAKELGLPNWDKPAMACLASRFPYGTRITAEKLTMVSAAEEALKARGFRGFRVRHHEAGNDFLARLELSQDDFGRLSDADLREEVDAQVREAGYHYVTVDLQGFRSGRLNDALSRTVTQIQVKKG